MAKPQKMVVPQGYASVLPYLHVKGAAKAMAFYTAAFGAKSKVALDMPGGTIMHAEMEVGGFRFMLADEMPEYGVHAPQPGQSSPLSLVIYVASVDKTVEKAVAAGATVLTPPKDEFYGCRMARLQDPFGHVWFPQQVLTHMNDATLKKTFKAMMKAAPSGTEPKPTAKQKK